MDRLSQLPDDMLIHILSFLSTEDAYRTSLLSRYWRQCWLLSANELDFNTSGFIKPQDLESLDEPALKRRFFKWVSRVLRYLRDHVEEASVLIKLRIQFPLFLEERHLKTIDAWLSYAFARRVQSLELDLLICSYPHSFFDYDPRLLGSGTEIDLSCLRSLSLSGINVSREDVDSFLLNCPFLEHLIVRRSGKLKGVKICSSALALKHLEITNCSRLEYVIVRETCLVSLTLTDVMKLVVENNANLVSVCVLHWYCPDGSALQMLSSCLSRLQMLTLYLGYDHDEVFDQIPKLIELKELTLVVAPLRQDVIVRLTTMLTLSPNLEKLVLDLVEPKFEENVEYKKGPKVSLHHLKAVEVRGYCGEKAEDELFKYVLEHVVAPMERIIFDPYTLRWNSVNVKLGWEIENVGRRVEMFKRVIPLSIKFIVL